MEHRRKYERLRKEREEKRAERDRLRRRAEAQVIHTKEGLHAFPSGGCFLRLHLNQMPCVLFYQAAYDKAKRKEQSSSCSSGGVSPRGFPGGMPGGGFPGGMPGGGFPGGMPGGGFPGGMPGGYPGGGMPGGFPGGGMPGNVDMSKILNVSD